MAGNGKPKGKPKQQAIPVTLALDAIESKANSAEVEHSLLGSIMMRPEALDDVETILKTADFYDLANAAVYATMRTLWQAGKGFDLVLLVNALKGQQPMFAGYGGVDELMDVGTGATLYEAVGGATYLNKLRKAVVTPHHAMYYAGIIREKSIRRHLQQACEETIGDLMKSDDTQQLVDRFEQRAFAVAERGVAASSNVRTANDLMMEAFARFDQDPEEANQAVKTGFNKLDAAIIGAMPNELIILAGRPGHGKTAAALAFAYNMAAAGYSTMMISLEMGSMELSDRLLSMRAQINLHRLRSLQISIPERESLVQAAGLIANLPLWVEDAPSRTVSQIAALARRHKTKHALRVLIVDYLQLIDTSDGSRNESRQEAVSRVSRKLKHLAKELSVPVICLAQVNRSSTETNRAPKLSELRESGALEQDADKVLFVFRPKYEDINRGDKAACDDPNEDAEIVIAKQRNGPCGPIKVKFLRSCGKFYDAPTYGPQASPFGAQGQMSYDEEPFV